MALALSAAQEPAADMPATAPPGVVVCDIHGQLDPTMRSLVKRALDSGRETGAHAVVFDIDTPGGEVVLMGDLARQIIEADHVQTVAFVSGQAWSAGAMIAMSCDRLFMAPGSSIGSAQPIQIGPGGITAMTDDPRVKEKGLSAMRADFRAKAEAAGRDGLLAEAMVDEDVEVIRVRLGGEARLVTPSEVDALINEGTLRGSEGETVCADGELLNMTAQEALRLGFADGSAASQEDLFLRLGLETVPVARVQPSWSEDLVRWLHGYQLWILIAACVLAFVELKVAGFGVPGIGAVVLFALLLTMNYLQGLAQVFEIVLVGAGILLVAVEIFVMPGAIFPGVAGAACVVGGLVLSSQSFLLPENPSDVSVLRSRVWTMVGCTVAVVLTSSVLSRWMHKIPGLRRFALEGTGDAGGLTGSAGGVIGAVWDPVGRTGVAVTKLRPAGKVDVDGHLLDAQTEGDWMDKGESVRVLRTETNSVIVGAVQGTQT